MDPNAAWKQLQAEMGNGDRARAGQLADGLVGWVSKGGALPDGWENVWAGGDVRSVLLFYLRDVRSVAEMV